MRAVQLDGLEAEPHRPLRRLAEGGGDAREALVVERLGRRPLGGEGNGRGRDGRPGVLAGSKRFAALPRPLAGGLAAGMPDLDGKARAGCRDAPRRVEHARERRLVGIRVEAETAVRDAPRSLDGGGLDHHHAGPRDGQLHQVLEMPIVALPSCAEYWHMGETTMRLGRSIGPSERGEKRWGTLRFPCAEGRQGKGSRQEMAACCY